MAYVPTKVDWDIIRIIISIYKDYKDEKDDRIIPRRRK